MAKAYRRAQLANVHGGCRHWLEDWGWSEGVDFVTESRSPDLGTGNRGVRL
jgi:hypothetical protein